MKNYKTTFDARGHDYNAAGELCPQARESERAAVLDRAALRPGLQILDLPAGGGYLAEGIRQRLGSSRGIVCVEPSSRFGAQLSKYYATRHESVDCIGLATGSCDRILSLAGLHHLPSRATVYREWARLLKPGGRIVVADVATDTGTGAFLNEFVHEFTPGGHEGFFIATDEFSTGLGALGLEMLEDALLDLPWRFRDRAELADFCWRLFSCRNTTPTAVVDGLERYVGLVDKPGGVELRWQLRCAVATAAPLH